ncbi:hypothetical protein [Romboutsia ilealis]|uniref:hypothetical protein n=1 Tax=Romboutsia ilealis TaxID=1115758 RepID=UPI00272D7167|nr:hypothetical protein [Romboutsia ilealis]
MYKHVVDSIKESTRKRFISQSEKDKFNKYDEIFIEKESAYTKNEFDEIVSDLETREETFNSSVITIDGSDNSLATLYEIKGNSIRITNESTGITNYTLSSLGKLQQDGQYKINIASCGKNIIGDEWEQGSVDGGTGELTTESHEYFNFRIRSKKFIPINKNYTHITYSRHGQFKASVRFFDKNKKFIYVENLQGFITDLEKVVIEIPPDAEYFTIVIGDINAATDGLPDNVVINPDTTAEEIGCLFEYGTEVTSYEPFIGGVEHEMLLPCNLEKIGNISDRLFINNKGIWCIEKNIKTVTIDETFIIVRNTDQDTEKTERYAIVIPDNDIVNINGLYYPVFSSKIKCILDANNINNEITEIATNIYGHNTSKTVHVKRLKTDDSLFTDLESFKNLMYGSTLKYVTESPEIIELSYDKNTVPMYKNQTHVYVIDSIVQPESIKLTAPLSMISTINTLSEKFIDIDNRIEKVSKGYSNSKTYHETEDSTQIIPNVSNGILDDIYIEGKTLVNLWGNKSEDFRYSGQTSFNPSTQCIEYTSTTNRYSNCYTKNINRYKPNAKYTLIVNVLENTFTTSSPVLRVSSNKGYGSETGISDDIRYIKGGFVGTQIFTITTLPDLSVSAVGLRTYVDNIDSEVGAKLKFNIIILEGDHTDKPLPYFEGLKSVGQGLGDKELVNLATRRENLQDGLTYDKATNTYISSVSATRFTSEPINVSYNETYTLMYEFMCNKDFTVSLNSDGMICRIDAENSDCKFVKTYAHHELHKTYKANRWYKITNVFKIDNNTVTRIIPCIRNGVGIEATMSMRNIMIFSGDQSLIKIPYFETTGTVSNPIELSTSNTSSSQYDIKHYIDKKALYYNKDNEWLKPILRSLPNGIKDTIEKHNDGKYYYHKRCGEVKVTEKDNIKLWTNPDNRINTECFYIENINEGQSIDQTVQNGISTMQYHTYNKIFLFDDIEGVNITNSYNVIGFRILKSKLSTPDVNGFKQWLQNNNVTVVFELENEEVYECTNIDLSLFENTTTFNIDSGYILPKVSFHTNDNIGNTIQSLKERLIILENYLSDKNTLHNRLMLSNRYSSDRTNFNVDVVTLSSRSKSSEIDIELIKLILSNISEGVLNYNRIWMEELIDFYTIMGIIPFEVADRLFELIESQYFEPSLDETL